LEHVLDVLATDSDQGRVYRALTSRGRFRREVLARDTGLTPEVVGRALGELAELDLVVELGKGTDLWEAAPPERVMSVAMRAEETRRLKLWQAGAELDRLYHQARSGTGCSSHVEPVEHPARLIVLATRLQDRATEQVRWLDRPPCHGKPHQFRAQEEIQARRMADGLRYRTVYSQNVYDDPKLFAAMTRMADLGENVRLLSELPVKLTIGDDRMALLVPEPDQAGLEGSLVVHASGMLNALCGLFETLWTLAMPVSTEVEQDQCPSGTAPSSR
jgi:hypothetical protein